MIKFKQFILLETIYPNATISQLKGLTKSTGKPFRIVIGDEDGKMAIGHATKHLHYELRQPNQSWRTEHAGWAAYDKETDSHIFNVYDSSKILNGSSFDENGSDHPIVQKMAGLYKRKRVPYNTVDIHKFELDECINEELVPKIHYNVTVNSLMGLAKEHGVTRFSITGNKVDAGNAHHFYHDQIGPNSTIDGAIKYNKETDKHTFYANKLGWPRVGEAQHPFIDRLNRRGCIRGSRSSDFGDIDDNTNKSLNEGKVITLDNKWAGEFKVFHNPSKAQVKTLNDNLQGGNRGMIRSLKYNDDHFVWDAYHGEHQETAKKLGIHAKDRGLFFHEEVKDGDYDIPKLHKDFNCQCRTNEY